MLRKVLLPLVLMSVLVPAATAAAKSDYAALGSTFNILTPGETGGLPTDVSSTDQMKLYDALTPLGGNVTTADLAKYYKSERFGVTGPKRVEKTGRAGLTLIRDQFNVPHIYGKTRSAAMFGAGWAAVEDRGLLLSFGVGPARVAMLDVPGINAFGLVTSARKFTPSPEANAYVHKQVLALAKSGKKGKQVVKDFSDWVKGGNAYLASTGSPVRYTLDDAMAGFAFIGSIFGNGGGDEVRNSQFLANLEAKYGAADGLKIFRDLRQVNVSSAPVSVPGTFPYNTVPTGPTPGSPLVDPGSASSATTRAAVVARDSHRLASNALLVSAKRSATGHPLAVMGPQLGYYYPEIMMEYDLHAPGIDVRGAAPPVQPYVLIGRGKDYAWSLTSASNDNTDLFLEQLCEPGGGTPTRASTNYLYKGKCIPMHRFDAGYLAAAGSDPGRELVFNETVHGPVQGTVTVKGAPYAVSRDRATRGRDPMGAIALLDLNENKVTGPKSFFKVANEFETTFNWHYIDDKNIAYFSSGRLPVRAKGVDPSLPTLGTGQYDWKGFLKQDQHPHGVNPRSGTILNWNNKPAKGWGAADSTWDYGSFFRVQAFTGFKAKNKLADVVSVMNRAATQDLRARFVWPTIAKMLAKGTAPTPLAAQAAALVTAWSNAGSSRLDAALDGKIDDPGAAVLDAAWPKLADAVLGPVLTGGLLDQFAALNGRDNRPGRGGSSYGGGWYGYVDTDLRQEMGDTSKGTYSRKYCGNGDVAACAASLWATVDAAAQSLATSQGADPAAWRSDANAERITFAPGLISDSMRWTNRPTFQQAISFSGHRKTR